MADVTGAAIRRAVPGDAAALSLLGSAAFLETYAGLLPGRDLIRFTSTRHDLQTYSAWLADPSVIIWLAESATGCPVGYLVLTPATIPAAGLDPRDLEVQRIYVLSPYHKTGLGSELLRLALAKAAASGARRLVLGVHNDNARALAFYARHGFLVVDKRTFQVGDTLCCDSVLAREITKSV